MAAPWHAAYPAPEHQPESLTREEVLKSMKEVSSVAKQDFVLIDLRRNDHEGGTIRGSINLPAQSLYPTIAKLYGVFKAAGLRKIIWYCSSSRGRGTRAAGWFSDYITNRGDSEMKSLVLLEGIKGWATAGGEFVEWMDEYEPAVWCVEEPNNHIAVEWLREVYLPQTQPEDESDARLIILDGHRSHVSDK